jgi:serine/threonine protein phosphatase PrpC
VSTRARQAAGADDPTATAAAPLVESFTLPYGDAAVFCARSPLKSTPNEDAASMIPAGGDRTVLAVADGMGGQPAGDQASDLALAVLAEHVGQDAKGPANLRVSIVNGIEAASARIESTGSGSGTTLAVVEVDHRSVRPYHVGDSMILVVGQRGHIRYQTVPHSPVGYAVESGLLDETDAMQHEDRHYVSNFVGAPDMRIEIGPTITLRPRDTVVIGSDGLFDNLHIEEVVEHVRKGPLAEEATRMATTCLDRMVKERRGKPSKADDVTFIVYRPHPGSIGDTAAS